MRDATPQAIQLHDYLPPAFRISKVHPDVDIRAGAATVRSTLQIERNAQAKRPDAPLVLDGEGLELLSATIDGRSLGDGDYRVDASHLTIHGVPEAFVLQTVVRFDPWKNTRLEGLYATASGLVTQCEAEGFRRITYFIDRPDVMARYSVTLCAERAPFPRLLANGNLVGHGEGEPEGWFAGAVEPAREAAGRHWARWEDPFAKPSYLFAMVAADLD